MRQRSSEAGLAGQDEPAQTGQAEGVSPDLGRRRRPGLTNLVTTGRDTSHAVVTRESHWFECARHGEHERALGERVRKYGFAD